MVSAFDAFQNAVSNFLGTIHFESSDARAVLPGDSTFTAADAGVNSFPVAFGTAGPQLVDVRFAGTVKTSVLPVTVTPGAAAKFAVSGFPATTAGGAQSLAVSALDAFGNPTTSYSATVAFSRSDVQAGLPARYTFTSADAGVRTFSAALRTAGAQSITVADVANPSGAGTEAAIPVAAAAATHFLLIPPATITSGKAFTLTVELLDAFGIVATGYRGKVQFKDSVTHTACRRPTPSRRPTPASTSSR